jgi:uncharacterized damage-inducible protein DinB
LTPEAIRRLYDYSYWASERVWHCVMQLTDEQFSQDVDYSRGSIRNQIVHTMSATRRWIKRIQGVEIPPHLPFEDYSTRETAKAKWDELQAEALEYIGALDQAQLDELVHWEIETRSLSYENLCWEILMHVANHATDHRAQILAMLHHHFGVMTVEQDMILYLAESTQRDTEN